ncbi:MAG: hypothetical protein IPJ21_08550 [Sterolibacteriaceae bacterium]|nr:hypothetical protein [Sterolibacteriaceae bacterium]MBK9083917.1 hypothetical protein [Sterolibacteriaceae bacterium]
MKICFIRRAVTVCWILISGNVMADISEATFTPQGSSEYTAIPVSNVEIFVYKPDFKFKVIGVIEARGMAESNSGLLDQLDVIGKFFRKPPGEKDDIALAMKALKSEAANAGATGVVIIQSQQVRVSNNATERQIKAAAIIRIE